MEISWKQVWGNSYKVTPTFRMYVHGEKRYSVTRLKGAPSFEKQAVSVLYDHTYVNEWFINLIKKFKPLSKQQWLKICSEAYDLYDAQRGESNKTVD